MKIKYQYKLIMAVNAENLKALDGRYSGAQIMDVVFQSVQGGGMNFRHMQADDVVFSQVQGGGLHFDNMQPEDVVISTVQGGDPSQPPAATTHFFAVKGEHAVKKGSQLEFVTIPLRAGITESEALTSLANGPLQELVKNCQHYCLYAIATEQ